MSRSRALAPVVAFVVLAVVVAVLPSFVSAFRAQQLAYVAIYLVALLGLNILTGYTGQISLGHGAFMAIGGYTTAILMTDHGVKDVWTIPLAGLVAGIVGFLFGIPALRLSGLYLALATFAVAVSMPAVIKRFEGFTGGGGGINLFGVPELTASLTPVTVLGRELTFNDWIYYLCWTIALVGYVVACSSCAVGPAARSAPCATARARRSRRGSASPRTRRWPSASAPHMPASRARSSPSRRPS